MSSNPQSCQCRCHQVGMSVVHVVDCCDSPYRALIQPVPMFPIDGHITQGKAERPRCADEAAILADIATMMSEFVENWPEPKRVSTAIALIAKTLRAALHPPASVAEVEADHG